MKRLAVPEDDNKCKHNSESETNRHFLAKRGSLTLSTSSGAVFDEDTRRASWAKGGTLCASVVQCHIGDCVAVQGQSVIHDTCMTWMPCMRAELKFDAFAEEWTSRTIKAVQYDQTNSEQAKQSEQAEQAPTCWQKSKS